MSGIRSDTSETLPPQPQQYSKYAAPPPGPGSSAGLQSISHTPLSTSSISNSVTNLWGYTPPSPSFPLHNSANQLPHAAGAAGFDIRQVEASRPALASSMTSMHHFNPASHPGDSAVTLRSPQTALPAAPTGSPSAIPPYATGAPRDAAAAAAAFQGYNASNT